MFGVPSGWKAVLPSESKDTSEAPRVERVEPPHLGDPGFTSVQ